jgi:hypothetical protein
MVFVTARGIYGLALPMEFGEGAVDFIRERSLLTTLKEEEAEDLGAGDVERLVIEWKCLLDLIAHGPDLGIPRWTELQNKARKWAVPIRRRKNFHNFPSFL